MWEGAVDREPGPKRALPGGPWAGFPCLLERGARTGWTGSPVLGSLPGHALFCAVWACSAGSILSWWHLGKGLLGEVRLPSEPPHSVGRNEGSRERECGRVGVRGSGWGCAGAPSTLGLPHLGQGFDAHQIHKADPTHVKDEGVEGDKGWDAGQHVTGLSRGWGLAVGSGGAVRAEGDVGHTGAVSRRLVVVGVGRGAVLKVLLELLQGDSLERGVGGWSQIIRLNQTSLWLKLGQGACRWR